MSDHKRCDLCGKDGAAELYEFLHGDLRITVWPYRQTCPGLFTTHSDLCKSCIGIMLEAALVSLSKPAAQAGEKGAHKIVNGHILWGLTEPGAPDSVTMGGLGVCKVCGDGEIGLDDPCMGKPAAPGKCDDAGKKGR